MTTTTCGYPNNMRTPSRSVGIVCACLLFAPSYLACAVPIRWETASSGNGHYYELVYTPTHMSWSDADAAAKASVYQGLLGHLATVTSPEENAFLVDNLLPYEYAGYWLGGFQQLFQSAPGVGWGWVTGEAWSYTAWNVPTGEPNDWPGSGVEDNQENYLCFTHEAHGTWNDAANEERYASFGYFVEYEGSGSVPDGGFSLYLLGSALAGLVAIGRKFRH